MESKRSHIFFAMLLVLATSLWTMNEWTSRPNASTDFKRSPLWSLDASASVDSNAFVRIEDTSFWTRRSNAVLTSRSNVATQNSGAVLKRLLSNESFVIAPYSVVSAGLNGLEVVSGFALKTTDGKMPTLLTHEGMLPALEPAPGFIHDLQNSGMVTIGWPKAMDVSNAELDFARDANFAVILFSQTPSAASGGSSVNIDFADRSPGAWFVRLRLKEKTLAMTSFNVVESQTPDQLRRLGRRWLSWRDRGNASTYRVEFAETENFKTISQSFELRNRELDLSRVSPGAHFARVTATSVTGQENTSRPIALQVQPNEEILRASLELNDPDLRLFARGWKIVLHHDELPRIREGYVILRESELRGVKVANEIFKEISRNDDEKRSEVLKSVVFELSHDEAFSNPERVRPDSHGELLPPALPLGVLYARLRRVEKEGTLGAYGPASRLTTWLPAPIPGKPIISARDLEPVRLNWELGTKVAGFELHISRTREFTSESTTAIRTREPFKSVVGADFFWTVTALNDIGQMISMTSEIQEVKRAKVLNLPRTIATAVKPREPAFVKPTSPNLQLPQEDAVIVGGATAKQYGKLKWEFGSVKTFEVQIATDNDFVHIIEKAKTSKPELTLQGDLPEGALFWRVRQAKSGEWSRSRKFELVYE